MCIIGQLGGISLKSFTLSERPLNLSDSEMLELRPSTFPPYIQNPRIRSSSPGTPIMNPVSVLKHFQRDVRKTATCMSWRTPERVTADCVKWQWRRYSSEYCTGKPSWSDATYCSEEAARVDRLFGCVSVLPQPLAGFPYVLQAWTW